MMHRPNILSILDGTYGFICPQFSASSSQNVSDTSFLVAQRIIFLYIVHFITNRMWFILESEI
jgi:hypothetical protein